jgi:hypothetical protein
VTHPQTGPIRRFHPRNRVAMGDLTPTFDPNLACELNELAWSDPNLPIFCTTPYFRVR